MILHNKSAQGLVEYLLLVGIVVAISVPFITPTFNNGPGNINSNKPQENELAKTQLTNAAHLTSSTSTTIIPSTSTSTSSDTTTTTQVSTFESAPVQIKKVYIFGNSKHACDSGMESYTLDTYFLHKNADGSGLDTSYFGGIFDRLQGTDMLDVAKNYCQNGNYNNKSVVINEDGTLFGVYSTKDLEDLNGIAFGINGGFSQGTARDQIISLPDGQKVYVVENAFVSPLVFDLDRNGIHTIDKVIKYDINGDKTLEDIHDIDPKDGILIIRQGKSGLDLFGDNTDLNNDGKPDGFKNGFDALRSLAIKEHLIKSSIMKLNSKDIAFLEKKYHFAMKTGGYLGKIHSLKSLGITEISLGSANNNSISQKFDKRGNILMYQEGASFKIHNKTNIFVDVWHKLLNAVKDIVKTIQHK